MKRFLFIVEKHLASRPRFPPPYTVYEGKMLEESRVPTPIIWCVSRYQLADNFAQILPEYINRANFDIIGAHSDEAFLDVKRKLRHEQCDVIISAGATAAYLKGCLDIPVIAVRIGGYDIMNSLIKARRIADKIGVVLHRTASASMQEFATSFSLPVEFRYYNTMQEARNALAELTALGIRAIVGSGGTMHMAEAAGLAGFFVYTLDSIRLAVEDALGLANAKLTERSRHSLLKTVLHNISDGVLAVDASGKLIAANAAADAITRCEVTQSIGLPLKTIVPDLESEISSSDTIRTGTVEEVAGHAVMVNRAPLMEANEHIGTILTLHSPGYVERAFSKLRAHAHSRSRSARYTFAEIVAESPNMRAVINRCAVFAKHSDATILLSGPSGSGKELLAQGIHNAGKRKKHPFVAVNCGAFPESLLESELFGYEEGAFTGARRRGKPGLFEAADKGTIFFDEIAELPILMQTRLLRVLQEREITRVGGHDAIPIDVRVIAATHQNLLQLVQEGSFREDLFYRLSVLRAVLPSLQERPEDLDILSYRLFNATFTRTGLEGLLPQVLAVVLPILQQHTWPGNVRELENIAERFAMACLETRKPPTVAQTLSMLDLLDGVPPMRSDSEPLSLRSEHEKQHIREALQRCNGNKDRAAKLLGVSRTTLWRLLKRYSGEI